MRKIISYLLVFSLIFSLSMLVGCQVTDPLDLDGYSNISEADKAIIQTVGGKYDYSLTNYDTVIPPNFVQKISSIKSSMHSLYKLSIDTDSVYYICGYGNSTVSTLMYMTFGEWHWLYDWYRVDSLENIEQTINGKELLYVFSVCDAIIERDIVDGTNYNYATKYYSRQDVEELREIVPLGETFLLYLRKHVMNNPTDTYIVSSSHISDGYSMYVDENGVEYLSFLHEKQIGNDGNPKNYSRDLFLDYYDILSPHFNLIDELRSEYIYNGNNIVRTYAGIEIETLLELLIK